MSNGQDKEQRTNEALPAGKPDCDNCHGKGSFWSIVWEHEEVCPCVNGPAMKGPRPNQIDVNAEYYKKYDRSEECPHCLDAAAKAIFAERFESLRVDKASLKVDDVDDVLDALAASISDGEIDYDDVRGPVGAQRTALELLRQMRIGLAIDPSSDRLRHEPSPIGAVKCVNCGASSEGSGSACPSGAGPQHDWEERDPQDEQGTDYPLAALRTVLADHYLTGIECDHEAKTDRASCACSRIRFPTVPSVGQAVQTWIDHVFDALGQRTDSAKAERGAGGSSSGT